MARSSTDNGNRDRDRALRNDTSPQCFGYRRDTRRRRVAAIIARDRAELVVIAPCESAARCPAVMPGAPDARSGQVPSVSREQVIALVGEIEPSVVAQIIASGATANEIAQALAEIEDGRAFDDRRTRSCSLRVAEVRAILEPLWTRAERIVRGRD